VLHNNLVFVKGVNRQYSDEFAKSGAKIGSTINVRKPNRYFVRTGPVMQVQNTTETYVPLSLTRQWGVDVNFTSVELTLSLDDFSKRILTPAMARLASQIDYEGLALFANVWNQVGTPGLTPGSAGGALGTPTWVPVPQIYLNAGTWLDSNACPRDENRRVVIGPAAMALSVASLSGLFQDQGLIAEQYRKGVMGTALGFEFAMDQNINMLTTGTRALPTAATVTVAGQVGASLLTTGWAVGATLRAGEIFSIAGVNAVNPENQQPIETQVTAGQGNQYFVVTANCVADAATNMTIPIAPSIVVTGAAVANGTVTNSPAAGALLTLLSGAASTAFPVQLAYHQDAFTLGTADLEMPNGVDFAARESYDGISIRIVRAFDILNDQFPCRIDVLGGWATLRPELACRIAG
jgi:hypothetical protein